MEAWENMIKILADDTRRSLIKLLLTHNYCVGALAKKLSVSEAAVSQHLRILREAGLVTGEKKGYFTHYRVNREHLVATAEKLLDFASQKSPEINPVSAAITTSDAKKED